MVALSKAAKEGYKGRKPQSNANTTINGHVNASRKKNRTELFTIRAANFLNSLPLVEISNTTTPKMDCTDVTKGMGCGCLHQLGAKHGNSRSLSLTLRSFCKHDEMNKQMRVNKREKRD